MTVFERTYRELQRLQGMSLHNEILLYKVAPERTEQEQRQIWSDAHLRAHFQQPKPWKLKAAIALGLISWFWYEVAKHLGWIG